MNWFVHSLKNYANFSGRANRREWWVFWFFCCTPAALVAVGVPNLAELDGAKPLVSNLVIPILVLVFLWNLVLLIPLLAVTIRRFHDIGLSGWWWLFTLVPILGGIFLLICTLIKGKPETNAYGEPPLSWTDQRHRDLARKVSLDLELERKSEEFLNQLSGCVGKDARPDSLSPEQKDMVSRFYMKWYPADYTAKEEKKWQTRYKLASTYGPIAFGAMVLISLPAAWAPEAVRLAVPEPLKDVLINILLLIFFPCFFVFLVSLVIFCIGESATELRGMRTRRAKRELLKVYSEDLNGRAAHDFFAKRAFPAVKKALSGKRSIRDPNVKEAVLQCVKEQMSKVA